MTPLPLEFAVDTHTATALFEERTSGGLSADERWRAARCLEERVADGHLRYVVTDTLLRELAPLESRNPVLYEQVKSFWFRLARGYFLHTPMWLREREIVLRRAVAGAERFVPEHVLLPTALNAGDPRFLKALDEREYEQKRRYASETRRVIADLRTNVFGVKKSASIVREWQGSFPRFVEDMVYDTLRRSPSPALTSDTKTWPKPFEIPILYRLCSYMAALTLMRIGENRRGAGSDMADALHYALGGYVDIFVTDDWRFREVDDAIPTKPFRVMSWSEFAQDYLNC